MVSYQYFPGKYFWKKLLEQWRLIVVTGSVHAVILRCYSPALRVIGMISCDEHDTRKIFYWLYLIIPPNPSLPFNRLITNHCRQAGHPNLFLYIIQGKILVHRPGILVGSDHGWNLIYLSNNASWLSKVKLTVHSKDTWLAVISLWQQMTQEKK